MGRSRRSHGEGAITERGPNKWRLRLEGPAGADGRRRQYSITVNGSKADALRALREQVRAQEFGGFVRPTRQTFGAYLAEWLDRHAAHVTALTRHGYARLIRNYLAPTVGGVELQRLEAGHLSDLYAALLARGIHPQTVKHAHRLVHKALADAVRLDRVARNVADAVEPPRVVRTPPATWTAADIARFLSAAQASPFRDFFHLAVLTGMRRAEIAALRWENVDLDRRTLRVTETLVRVNGHGLVRGQPKSERSRRVIALSQVAVDLLRQVRVAQLEHELAAGPAWEGTGHVFTDLFGMPYDADRATKAFARIAGAAGLPHATLHSLRHAHASLLLSQGVHVKVLSERLGHASVSFTMDVYGHLLPGMQEKAAEAIDAALGH
jgi:integrase